RPPLIWRSVTDSHWASTAGMSERATRVVIFRMDCIWRLPRGVLASALIASCTWASDGLSGRSSGRGWAPAASFGTGGKGSDGAAKVFGTAPKPAAKTSAQTEIVQFIKILRV